MEPWIPQISDILTAVVSLARRGGEQLRVPQIHSVLSELRGKNVVLSGLCFSIMGAVCYSRQVDEALRMLVAKGILVLKDRDTLVVRDEAAEEIKARLRKKLPPPAYRMLKSASRNFYGRMVRNDERSDSGDPPG